MTKSQWPRNDKDICRDFILPLNDRSHNDHKTNIWAQLLTECTFIHMLKLFHHDVTVNKSMFQNITQNCVTYRTHMRGLPCMVSFLMNRRARFDRHLSSRLSSWGTQRRATVTFQIVSSSDLSTDSRAPRRDAPVSRHYLHPVVWVRPKWKKCGSFSRIPSARFLNLLKAVCRHTYWKIIIVLIYRYHLLIYLELWPDYH